MAEAEQNETWVDSIEDEGLKESLGKFEDQGKFFEAIGYKVPEPSEPTDWRDGLSEDLKKTADRFTSRDEAVRALESFRKRESQVRVPGKDPTEEEVSAYRKAIGIPEKAEDYEFPQLPEGQELTDGVKAEREEWSKLLHTEGISNKQAAALFKQAGEIDKREKASQIEADKDFAKTSEEELRSEWKGDDYDKNTTLANRAYAEIANRAGLSSEELGKIETKDGRLLMDRPEMLKIFAVIGREMSEGTLGPALSETERDTVDDTIRDVQKQIDEAQGAQDSKRANKLYQKKMALIEKRDGNQPIVGANGRAA